MTRTDPPRHVWTPTRLGVMLGIVAALSVVFTLADPGLTTDEPLDVKPGRKYVKSLLTQGLRFFDQPIVNRVFADNAEHPPLGRWLLGIASTLGEPFETRLYGPDPLSFYLLSARLAPALAFALLVALVVRTSARRYGPTAGIAAGSSLLLMPRVFAHAHLAALDTFITLFWTAALFASDRALTSRRPILAMAGAGAFWGLALLTKIHAWFLIPVVLVWVFVRLGGGPSLNRPLLAFATWAATGLAIFFAGWPWLWHDTASRFLRFLGTGVERAQIQVLYFGTVYADHDVPWHYPWFYFAVTVPLGLHLLGLAGLFKSWSERQVDRFPALLVGSIALFLVLFSTRIPVYDGERLFLIVFPLWAVVIGRGFAWLWETARGTLARRAGLAVILAAQSYGLLAFHPFGLSYYNVLVGGLPGAESLDLELTYWGDAVDRVLLDRLVREVPPAETVALVPTLYPGQGIATTTRAMARRTILLSDEDAALRAGWVVVSRRTAYWRPDFRKRLSQGRPVLERRRQGVWLSAIYALPVPPPPAFPRRP